MGYLNQYSDSGTMYDLQDKRIGDISASDVGKVPTAKVDGTFEYTTPQASKASGNLSLEKTIHYLTTATKGTPAYYIAWKDMKKWKNISFAATCYYYPDTSEITWGGVLASTDGFSYLYEPLYDGSTEITNYGFASLCGGSNTIIASTYETSPRIYYRDSNGYWHKVSNLTFSAISGGGYLDLSYNPYQERFIAAPHTNSSQYAYSNDGINWTLVTLTYNNTTITAASPIIYGPSGFSFYGLDSDTSKAYCYYSKDGLVWERGNVIDCDAAISKIYSFYYNKYYYTFFTTSDHVLFYMGTAAETVEFREYLDGRTSPEPSIATSDTIKYAYVIGAYLFIWTGGHTLNKCDITANTSVWESVEINTTSYVPDELFITDTTIYASKLQEYVAPATGEPEKANVYTSADYAKTWQQGIYEYKLSQASESSDDEDTTTIVMNLLRRDDGDYEIGGQSTRSYRKTFEVADWVVSGSTYVLTINQTTHNCGTSDNNYLDLVIDVYTASPSTGTITKYSKFYGYPSTGWQVDIDMSGNVTLAVSNAAARFRGAIVIK